MRLLHATLSAVAVFAGLMSTASAITMDFEN